MGRAYGDFPESLLDGEPMEYGDGLQTRSFTYVSDTVGGSSALVTPEARGEIINVGGTESITILELAEVIQSKLGIPLPLKAKLIPYETLPASTRRAAPCRRSSRPASWDSGSGVARRGPGSDTELAQKRRLEEDRQCSRESLSSSLSSSRPRHRRVCGSDRAHGAEA